MNRTSFWIGLLAVLTVCFATIDASAQPERSGEIDTARIEFAQLRAAIEAGSTEDVSGMEARIRALRENSRNRLAAIDRELSALNAQISALGTPPGENAPQESASLIAERSSLNDQLAAINSQRIRVNANIIEAGDLLARISATRLQSLYASMFERGASPLSPEVWKSTTPSVQECWEKISAYFDKWAEKKNASDGLGRAIGFIALAIAIAIFLFGPVHRWITRNFSAVIEKREATPPRRVLVAGLRMLARAVPGLIGGAMVMETLRATGVLTQAGEIPARALWFGFVIYLLVSGFLNGLFSPANPRWRIAPVDAGHAKIISLLINAVVVIFGTKILLTAILTTTHSPLELILLIKSVVAIIVSVLFFLLCRTRLWRTGRSLGFASNADGINGDDEDPDTVAGKELDTAGEDIWGPWRLVRRAGRAVAIGTIIATLLGYVDLADFVVSRLYYLSIILAFGWFLQALLFELAQYLWQRQADNHGGVATKEERERSQGNARFWNRLIINSLLVLAVAPAIFVLIGFAPEAILDFMRQALFGFSVGGVQVPSIFRILCAVLVFIGVIALTKIAQRGFKAGPFAHSQIDSGVQDSLITLIGYAGLLVALFTSISAIGFDLSNLALIAGALSVGIGFGLQSIVNNFVSGLILLFERPIKVGDWIVTASGEGTVQKISVRSTEIETFDRSSIIVPNSELISSTVTNWTHKNKLGRISVPVGVAYGSDVERVRDILLACANEHALVVRYPEPFVVWKDFADSSLNFELRAYLSDISKGLSVRTELRFAINKGFAENGIEIPFPQRDIHVKSWPDGGPVPSAQG